MYYIDINLTSINLIKHLWNKNRLYHEQTSEFFGKDYQSICFEERMTKFNNVDDNLLKITICKDNNDVIGYCISKIDNNVGEVESIHVEESKRGNGIGESLVNDHLEWMKEMNCERIGVTVSQENASTIHFYEKLGFYPNTLYMEQLTE